MLVGWLLLIEERFSLVRLLTSALICLLHLLLVAQLRPFKKRGNNMLALVVGLCMTFAFVAAIFLKVHQVRDRARSPSQ